jgi:hypothetical protein
MWTGVATTPWTPNYKVSFTFSEDGQYSAKSMNPEISPALYYISDTDSPNKIYSLSDVAANNTASGFIILWDTNFETKDDIKSLTISQDMEHLSFEVWHGGYGHRR